MTMMETGCTLTLRRAGQGGRGGDADAVLLVLPAGDGNAAAGGAGRAQRAANLRHAIPARLLRARAADSLQGAAGESARH